MNTFMINNNHKRYALDSKAIINQEEKGMKNIGKVSLAIVLILLLCLSLFAQGSKEQTQDQKEVTGKQKIIWAAYGYLSEGKADKIKAAFESEYPQYDVEYVDLGSSDYLMRMDTMIAAGERVDMALTMDSPEYVSRAQQGMFLPIENYLSEDGFDIQDAFGTGIKASYVNGKLYGLPYTKGGFYVFYNKDMFDAAGLSYPTDDWTWSEFETTAEKLTTKDVFGANVHFTWGYDIETLPARMNGWSPFTDGNYNQANMMDPRLKDSLEMWNRMQTIEKSAISLSTFKAEQIGSRMPFAKGQAAMLLSNWWSASWFINSKFGSSEGDTLMNFNMGAVNVPRPDASVPNNLNSTELDWYFAVPATAENPKGGALLARFMICEMWSKLGTLSSYKYQDLDEFMKKFVTYEDKNTGKVYTMNYSPEFVKKIMGGWTQPISTYYGFDSQANPEGLAMVKDIYDQERELYYNGEQDIDTTMAAMQKRIQAELDSQKK
jgi:multiple sugar transport system substrate-binding protein